LEDGIRSYLSRVASVRAEAEFWINCRRRNFPFAFNVICDTLGLEVDAVVTAIRRMREQNVSPRRAIRRSRPNVRRTGRIRLRARRKSAAAPPKKRKQLDGYGPEEHRVVAGSKEEGLVGPDIGVHPADGESDVRLSFDPAPPDPAVREDENPEELLPLRPRAVGE